MKKIISISILILLLLGMLLLSGCSSEYDRTETELVQATVVQKNTYHRIVCKRVKTEYAVTFGYEDLQLKLERKSLYDWLDEGDKITMRKTTYYKDNEVVKTDLRLIE